MAYCTNCGAQQSEESKFCHNCGTKVLIESAPTLNKLESPVDNQIGRQQIQLLTASVLSPEGDLKYGKIDLKGNWIIQPLFDDLDESSVFEKDDLIIATLDGEVGCIDLAGNWVIAPEYTSVEKSGRFFIVGIEDYQKGVIDKSANWVLKPVFKNIRRTLNCDKWLVSVEDKWGVVDIKGNQAVKCVFEELHYFVSINGRELAAAKLNDKYGYINNVGQWVLSPIYDEAEQFDERGFAVISISDKWGIIDVTGTFIVNPIYEELHEDNSRDFAIARYNEKYGVIDLSGSWIIKPDFDELLDFDDQGISPAKVNGKWGIVDLQGKWIIEPKFDEIENSSISSRNLIRFNDDGEGVYMGWFDRKGYCAVEINKRNGFIDINGGWLIDPILDEHSLRLSWSEISTYDVNDRLIVRANGKFGLLDRLGKYVVDPEYYVLELIECGIYKASKNNKYGFIDYSGNWIIPPRFDYIFYDIWDLNGNEEKDWDEVLGAWVDCEEDEDEDYPEYDFEGYFGNLIGNEKIYLGNNIPEKKIKSFAKENINIDFLNSSEYCVYYDSTVWGKGDNGFAILQHSNGMLYLFIDEYVGKKAAYCLGNDGVNLTISYISYTIKLGLTIHSINPNTLEKYEHNISSFTKKDVTEALYNFLIENTVLFDEDNEDYEDAIEDDDPLGIRVNTTSTDQNDPLGLRN